MVRKDGHELELEYQARVFPDGSIISYWYPQQDGKQ
jgi:hypothetical protein